MIRLPVRAAVLAPLALVGVALLVAAARIDRPWYEVHVLVARCAVFPREVDGIARLRVILAVAGLLVLAALRPLDRLLVLAARRVSRGALVRVGLAVVLALGVSECVLRSKTRVGRAPGAPPVALPPAHHDAKLDWAVDGPKTTVLDADGRPLTYAFDAWGDRVRAESEAPDPARPTIVFAGESVTMGLGVAWEEAYPTLVGQRLGVQVVNAGVHGYGDDQIYLAMLDRLARLEHPVAVVTIALADLLERDVSTWRDRLVVGAGGALVVAPKEPEWLRESPLAAFVERVSPWGEDPSLRVARALFVATDRAARARGARALFLLTNFLEPCMPDGSGRPAIEARLFDGLAVKHVRVDLDPTWIVASSLHPDARAHAKLAEGVIAALREDGGVAP